MREISFKTDGILKEGFIFKKVKANEILILKTDKTYIFNDKPYYIMEGRGRFYIEDMPHEKPQFNLIDIKNLDYYMQNETHISLDYDEQRQIESFYNISFYNTAYKEPRLYTQEFKDLEKRLYGIEKQDKGLTWQKY